ncbi:MAG: hypothetical protein ACREXT_03315 [Gammaproteobacteria bacterium]
MLFAPQRATAGGIERDREFLLSFGADRVAARCERRLRLTLDLKPPPNTAGNQPIHQRSARQKPAIEARLVVEGANLGGIRDEH